MEQMRRNLKRVVWILAVLILALVVRLFWIQILGSEDLKQAVCDQSLISLQGANTRGLIYDRNGLPMVADHKRYLYIIRKKDMVFRLQSFWRLLMQRKREAEVIIMFILPESIKRP